MFTINVQITLLCRQKCRALGTPTSDGSLLGRMQSSNVYHSACAGLTNWYEDFGVPLVVTTTLVRRLRGTPPVVIILADIRISRE